MKAMLASSDVKSAEFSMGLIVVKVEMISGTI